VLLVMDATHGPKWIASKLASSTISGVTGIVLTKLDGTANAE